MTKLTCPMCQKERETKCVDSRPSDVGGWTIISRRRLCLSCGHRWRTAEVPFQALEKSIETAEAAMHLLQLQPADAASLRRIADAIEAAV